MRGVMALFIGMVACSSTGTDAPPAPSSDLASSAASAAAVAGGASATAAAEPSADASSNSADDAGSAESAQSSTPNGASTSAEPFPPLAFGHSASPDATASASVPRNPRVAQCCASLQQTPPSVPPKYAGQMLATAQICNKGRSDPKLDDKRFLHRIWRSLPAALRSHYRHCQPEPLQEGGRKSQ